MNTKQIKSKLDKIVVGDIWSDSISVKTYDVYREEWNIGKFFNRQDADDLISFMKTKFTTSDKDRLMNYNENDIDPRLRHMIPAQRPLYTIEERNTYLSPSQKDYMDKNGISYETM